MLVGPRAKRGLRPRAPSLKATKELIPFKSARRSVAGGGIAVISFIVGIVGLNTQSPIILQCQRLGDCRTPTFALCGTVRTRSPKREAPHVQHGRPRGWQENEFEHRGHPSRLAELRRTMGRTTAVVRECCSSIVCTTEDKTKHGAVDKHQRDKKERSSFLHTRAGAGAGPRPRPASLHACDTRLRLLLPVRHFTCARPRGSLRNAAHGAALRWQLTSAPGPLRRLQLAGRAGPGWCWCCRCSQPRQRQGGQACRRGCGAAA